MNRKNRNKPAFTLIELLVVIAIIGLLSTISIISLNQARSKARDARRVADMHQLVTAINMYYSVHGEYPPISGDYVAGVDKSTVANFMGILIDEDLISSSPKDPWNNKNYFYYYYLSPDYSLFSSYCAESSAKYALWFTLESNTSLNGFARNVSGNATEGYRRAICFY